MTTSELQDLIVATLTRRIGGDRRRWRGVVGNVRLYDVATHPHCNWSVEPSGGAGEVAAVQRLLDDLRGRHPIVTPG